MVEQIARTPFSRSLVRTIDDIRDKFVPYVRTWDALAERKRDLAPAFVAAFRFWKKETGRSFVAFVQQLDPTVPADKASYVRHRSMTAARYLLRVIDAPQTVYGAKARTSRTPFDMLAVVVKSALPMIRPYEAEMWSGFASASRWHPRDIQKLQARVRRVRPIALRPDVPRLVVSGRREFARLGSAPIVSAADRG